MNPLGVKTCGESEFDIFEAKKRFPDPGKACVIELKILPTISIQLFLYTYFGHFQQKKFEKNQKANFHVPVSLYLRHPINNIHFIAFFSQST
jgi:hypothetical protein